MENEVRHDLNNFLSTIITYADLLMQDLEPDSAQYKFARTIFQSGVQAMENINGKRVNTRQPEHMDGPAMRSTKQLLIVDDQPDILAAMQIILKQCGYRAEICGNVGELNMELQGRAPEYDLVILDESMPGEQGHEVASRIEQDYPGLPVLLVTGYKKGDLLPLTGNIPCIRDIVEKSAMVTQLVDTVDRILF